MKIKVVEFGGGMSTFQDLMNVITNLPTGTVFSITVSWCTSQGLCVNPNMMKSWGLEFAKCFSNCNCGQYTVSPTQGTASHKSSNNLCHYIKL